MILNQSKPIMVVYYDETVVRSWKRYLTIKHFITDRAMGPLRTYGVTHFDCYFRPWLDVHGLSRGPCTDASAPTLGYIVLLNDDDVGI